MKRALLVAFFLIASYPASAFAAPGEAVQVKLGGVQRGAVIEGTAGLTAEATSAAGIKRIEIKVGDQVVESAEPSGVKQQVDLSYAWVTTLQIASSDLALNGEYTVTARAVANGGADSVTTATVIVDNPAATPAGVTAISTDEGVQVAWEPNPEPDLLGYQIERNDGTGFAIIGETTETSVIDPVGYGTYAYRVTAIRSSAARSSGRPSSPSAEAAITIEEAAAKGSAGRSDEAGTFGGLEANRGFKVADGAIAPRGLPSGVRLPGAVGLPDLPEPATEWGTFEEELPYEIPEGGIPLSATLPEVGETTWTLIPSDGLRWIAAGALLIALATLLRLVASRLKLLEGPPPLKL